MKIVVPVNNFPFSDWRFWTRTSQSRCCLQGWTQKFLLSFYSPSLLWWREGWLRKLLRYGKVSLIILRQALCTSSSRQHPSPLTWRWSVSAWWRLLSCARHYYVSPLESCGAGGVSDSSYYLLGFLDSRKWEEREKETKRFGLVSWGLALASQAWHWLAGRDHLTQIARCKRKLNELWLIFIKNPFLKTVNLSSISIKRHH